MARKEPDPPHELDPLKGGLKHNPFAALRKKLKDDSAQSVPAAQGGVPAGRREGSAVLREEHGAVPEEPGAVRERKSKCGGRVQSGTAPANDALREPDRADAGRTAHEATAGHELKGAQANTGARKAADVRDTAAAHPPRATGAARSVTIRERVSVRIERAGHGGKTVTIAEGPGLAERKQEPLALELLVREIARAMGTGARIEGAAIVVQGDQRERLITWLLARGFTGAIAGN